MNESAGLDILKRAILLEKRGEAFYTRISEQTDNAAVKDFFRFMAEEETQHVAILSEQYRKFRQAGKIDAAVHDARNSDVASQVLNSALKARLSAAGFEAAAISAAMAMEQRAISLYSQRARETDDAEEKALYQWLATWEGEHLRMLSDLDRELTESVWNDNQFWPF